MNLPIIALLLSIINSGMGAPICLGMSLTIVLVMRVGLIEFLGVIFALFSASVLGTLLAGRFVGIGVFRK